MEEEEIHSPWVMLELVVRCSHWPEAMAHDLVTGLERSFQSSIQRCFAFVVQDDRYRQRNRLKIWIHDAVSFALSELVPRA